MAADPNFQQYLEKYIITAKSAGVPKDQIENFINHGYVAYPWQLKFHAIARQADKEDGPTQIGLGGARGPGKSYAIFAQCALDDCQRVPGLKGLFLRQTGKAAKESLEDLVAKVLANKIQYDYSSSSVSFPNGSRLLLGGFKDERDIDKYVGIEYDFIAIEEINQLTEQKVVMLLGSMRTTKDNWRPRLYCSFNPGGKGHGYVKYTFVLPYRQGLERTTRFIPATSKDNPNLKKEYLDYLENLEGQLGKAWRDGDFDILAGQFFTSFRYDCHAIEPYTIPLEWKRVASLDYGYTNQSSLHWSAISPEKQVIVYRELYQTGLTFSQLAEEFVAHTGAEERIDYLVADPAIWAKSGTNAGALSGAEIFEARVRELWKDRTAGQKSINLVRGNNDRLSGWAAFREALRLRPAKDPYTGLDKVTSTLVIFNNCTELLRTIPLMVHDSRNPEDLDTDLEDHCCDDIRYLLMEQPKPSLTPQQISTREFAEAMKRKHVKMGGTRNNYPTWK